MKLIIIILFSSMLFSSDKYKEPSYALLEKDNNIEIREYGSYIVARTSINVNDVEENNMFRTLASYIFGSNEKNQSIPMTAPVTTLETNDTYEMLFYMLESDHIEDLPNPSNQNITFEKFNLGKCAVISFSWFVNEKKIKKYQNELNKFLTSNGYRPTSPFMVNRYDPPWKLPFMRRNEILVKID